MEAAVLNASSALAVALTTKPLLFHNEWDESEDLELSIRHT